MNEVFKRGEEVGVEVTSAARFIGMEEDLLEARRDELYGKKKKRS